MIQCLETTVLQVNIHAHRLAIDGELTVCNHSLGGISFPEPTGAINSGHTLYSMGLHPWTLTSSWLHSFRELSQKALDAKVIAIGEAGLDKICATPYALQSEVFEAHIQLSEQLQKPLLIHCVKAIDDVIAWHKLYKPQQAWVLHGFRGNRVQAHLLQKLGFYLSFGQKHQPDALAHCRVDLMFLETDEQQGSIAPLYLRTANLKNMEEVDLKKKILHNFKQITHNL